MALQLGPLDSEHLGAEPHGLSGSVGCEVIIITYSVVVVVRLQRTCDSVKSYPLENKS